MLPISLDFGGLTKLMSFGRSTSRMRRESHCKGQFHKFRDSDSVCVNSIPLVKVKASLRIYSRRYK